MAPYFCKECALTAITVGTRMYAGRPFSSSPRGGGHGRAAARLVCATLGPVARSAVRGHSTRCALSVNPKLTGSFFGFERRKRLRARRRVPDRSRASLGLKSRTRSSRQVGGARDRHIAEAPRGWPLEPMGTIIARSFASRTSEGCQRLRWRCLPDRWGAGRVPRHRSVHGCGQADLAAPGRPARARRAG